MNDKKLATKCLLILFFAAGACLFNGSAAAQTVWTWTQGSGTNNWNSNNWSSSLGTGTAGQASPSTSNSDTAIFTGTTPTSSQTVVVDNGWNVQTMAFDNNADSYTIAGGPINFTKNGGILISGSNNSPLNSVFNINSNLNFSGTSGTIQNFRFGGYGSGYQATLNINGNLSGSGSTTVTIQAGILVYGSGVVSGTINVNGSITDSGGPLSLNLVNSLGQSGPALIWLNGTNTYTGVTSVTDGMVGVSSPAALGSFASASGTLRLNNQSISHQVGVVFTGTGGTASGIVEIGASSFSGGQSPPQVLDQSGSSGLLNFTSNLLVTGTSVENFQLQGSTSGTGQFSGLISDGPSVALNLIKKGTGLWILPNANTYSGTTSIIGGNLNIRSSNGVGTGPVTVSSGAAFQLQSGSGLTLTNALSLSGSGVNNAGALENVSGSNTYTGLITLNGTTRINSDAGTLYLNTGGINLGAYNLTIGGIGNTVIGSSLTGSGGLTKDGTSTLTLLSDAVSYTGSTTVSTGVLNIQSGAALGSGTVSVTSGAALQLQSGSGIGVGNVLQISGSGINNDGALRNVSGSNTYSGPITLTAVSRINSDAGTLYLTTGGISLGSNTLTVGGSGNANIGSIISGSGGLTKDGGGILTLTNSNSFTGGVILSYGTLSIGDGTASHDGSIASSGMISLANTTAWLAYNLSSTASRTYSGLLTGPGNLQVLGSGTLTLAGTNTFTGSVYVNGGNLILGSTGAVNNAAIDATSSGSSITLYGGGTPTSATLSAITGNTSGTFGKIFTNFSTVTNLVINSPAGLSNSTSAILADANPGSVATSLTMTGSGTQVLTGLNTYTGVTTINSGTLSVNNLANAGNASAIGKSGTLVFGAGVFQYTGSSVSTNITGTATSGVSGIDVANSSTLSWGGPLQSVTTLNKFGVGTLDLSGSIGTITFLNLNAGTVYLNTGGAFSFASILSSGTLVFKGGNANNFTTLDGTVDLNGYSTNSLNRLTTSTVTGTAHTGLITNGSANSTSTINVNNGTGGSEVYANIQDGAGKVALNFTRTTQQGTLQLSGNNTYSGSTAISGTCGLYANSSTALSPNSAYTLTGSGSVGLSLSNTNSSASYSNSIGSLSGSNLATVALGNATLTMGGNNTNTTFAGIISGASGGITKAGTGTMILTNINSYTGTTTISGGVLQIGAGTNGNDGSIGTSSAIVNNASLVYNLSSTATRTYGNIISGTGSLTKSGSGTLILNGANTFSGNTLVTSGSLIVSGSLSLTGSVSVSSAGTLNVSGVVNNAALITLDGVLRGQGSVGAVMVNAGGELAPGDTINSGTLSVAGNITLTNSTSKLTIRLAQSSATSSDQIKLGSGSYSVNLNNATLNLTLGGYFNPTVGSMYTIIDGSSSLGTISGIFAQNGSITVGSDSFDILYNKNSDNTGSGNYVLLRLATVPEPDSLLILALGSVLLLLFLRVRRQSEATRF